MARGLGVHQSTEACRIRRSEALAWRRALLRKARTREQEARLTARGYVPAGDVVLTLLKHLDVRVVRLGKGKKAVRQSVWLPAWQADLVPLFATLPPEALRVLLRLCKRRHAREMLTTLVALDDSGRRFLAVREWLAKNSLVLEARIG